MANYKRMYTKLFNTVSDTIERLQQVQKDTERIYMEDRDSDVISPELEENIKESIIIKHQ